MAVVKGLLKAWFTIFFGYIEPVSALVGAYFAQFKQHEYLALTHPLSLTRTLPLSGSVVLSQLANLYLLFAINETLVLRCTRDTKVWRAFLFGLLVADLGHLYSLKELGTSIYWDTRQWNAIHLGNVPFVYVGAFTRLLYILFPQRISLL